jgi:hypothetical protein
MRRRMTKRERAAIECATLDVAELTAKIEDVSRSGLDAMASLMRLSAAFECAALDEIERLDRLQP